MKISIITVCYNSEKTISKTLESILYQSFKDVEHIIIDGKSTDSTLSIISKFLHNKKVISEPDKGIYDAMNKGIEIATGDIIGFLNSDDFYVNNNILSSVTKIFENNSDIDACYSDLIYVNQTDTSNIVRFVKSKKFYKGLFSKGWCPPHPTFFVRRSIYERFGKFDLNYSIASDVDLMMRFLEMHNIKSKYIPEVWVKMRMGGITNKNFRNIWLQNKEIILSFKKNNLSVNFLKFFVFKILSRSLQFFKKPTQ